MKNKKFYIAGLILTVLAVVGTVGAYSGVAPKVVVEGDYIEAGTQVGEAMLGGTSNYTSSVNEFDGTVDIDGAVTMGSTLTVTGAATFSSSIAGQEKTTAIAATSVYATTTLTVADSGTTYVISASGTTITLPAVASSDGVKFRFVIGGAVDTGNVAITSAEGDNIEGSIIVAGAVVDCNAADVLTFVADGENLGDFVEVMSNGTNWFPLASGALTGSKFTCSG